jgi:long-chain fatty acid transport protein
MKKAISVIAFISLLIADSAAASGWRIPEQSVDSTARAGASVASSSRGDAAYFNPANMAWMADTWHLQANATYINLASIKYTDARTSAYNGETEDESFVLPTGFMVSPSFGGARIGLAIVEPFGLSKKWNSAYQQSVAEEFSLETVEVNPTVAYSFNNKISIAGGIRMLYADATARSDASGIGVPLSRDMSGDTVEWGWNVAASVRPMQQMNISATYRSNIDMKFKDDAANLNLMGTRVALNADVTIPAPAVFTLAFAYDVLDNLNVEVGWDRTFWSEYEALDFNFSPNIPGNPYEAPQTRNWDDTDAFRISAAWGVTHMVTLMAGFAYDQNPEPDDTVGFELPDSDAYIYSLGAQFKVSDHMDVGVAALYDYKKSREVKVNATDRVYGEFKDASAFLLSLGLNYRF